MVFLGPTENTKFVSKIHVTNNTSHASLPEKIKIS